MEYQSRSPRVVAAHFFAKYGYDNSLQQVSLNIGSGQNRMFWKDVVDILDELRRNEAQGKHPCAALPPKKYKSGTANKGMKPGHQKI